MIGQAGALVRPTLGPCLPTGRLRRQLGLRPGNVGIEVFQAELKLIVGQPLGTAPEATTLQRLDHLPQPVDLRLRLRPLAVERHGQLADHPMQRRDVGR